MQIRCSNCFQEYDDALGLCPNCGYMEGEDFAEAYCLAPGTRISERYIIGETLGLGGFGVETVDFPALLQKHFQKL